MLELSILGDHAFIINDQKVIVHQLKNLKLIDNWKTLIQQWNAQEHFQERVDDKEAQKQGSLF